MNRGLHRGHRRNNSAHISSSELPFEQMGVHLDELEIDDTSRAASSLDDHSPLEEGVDASSLNGFNIADDPSRLSPTFVLGAQEISPASSHPVSNSELVNRADVSTARECEVTYPETDDSKAAKKRTESSMPTTSVAPALLPPSSAPVSLMKQEEPKFEVSLSPVKSPIIVIPSDDPSA